MGARTRPLRPLIVIFGWQTAATLLVAGLAAWLGGAGAAISAVLGGAVALGGGIAFAFFVPRRTVATPWEALSRMLRAEAAKVGAIVLLLWLVLTVYKELVMPAFFGSFILAVIIFSMAIFVRNPVQLDTGNNNVD